MGGLCLWIVVSVWQEISSKAERAVYKSYVSLAMLYRSEAWFLRESELGIVQRTERSMV